jgi:hypothetical protein
MRNKNEIKHIIMPIAAGKDGTGFLDTYIVDYFKTENRLNYGGPLAPKAVRREPFATMRLPKALGWAESI